MSMNSVLDGLRVRRITVIHEEIDRGLKLIYDKCEVLGTN